MIRRVALACVLVAAALGGVVSESWAQPKVRSGLIIPRDNMFRRQGYIQPEQWLNLAAADTDYVASVLPGPVASDTTISITFSELTVPRGISLTLSGTNTNVDASTVTITGLNWARQTITEDFALDENMPDTTLYGLKAFLDVTTVDMEQQDGANVKVSLGISNVCGLPVCSPVNGVQDVWVSGTKDTAPTVAVHATSLDQNTITFYTAPNGTNDYMFWEYVPPFASTTGVTIW